MLHPNPNIKALTRCIFDIKDDLDSDAKCILDEIWMKFVETSQLPPNPDSIKKKTEPEQTKNVHIVGSFLNRKSTITKSISDKLPEKNDKIAVTLPEPDSQVNNIYYFIILYMFYIYLANIFKFVLGLCIHKNRFEI